MAIQGVNKESTANFIAEMGVEMSEFKSAKHLASWAGVSPENYESAGRMKAKIASAHLILTIVYTILKKGEPYQELGSDYLMQIRRLSLFGISSR